MELFRKMLITQYKLFLYWKYIQNLNLSFTKADKRLNLCILNKKWLDKCYFWLNTDFVQKQNFWIHTVHSWQSVVFLQITERFARNWQYFCPNVIIENLGDTHKSGQSNNRFKCCSPSLGLRALALFLKMNCTTYIHLQDTDSCGTSSTSELVAEQESEGKFPGPDTDISLSDC